MHDHSFRNFELNFPFLCKRLISQTLFIAYPPTVIDLFRKHLLTNIEELLSLTQTLNSK